LSKLNLLFICTFIVFWPGLPNGWSRRGLQPAFQNDDRWGHRSGTGTPLQYPHWTLVPPQARRDFTLVPRVKWQPLLVTDPQQSGDSLYAAAAALFQPPTDCTAQSHTNSTYSSHKSRSTSHPQSDQRSHHSHASKRSSRTSSHASQISAFQPELGQLLTQLTTGLLDYERRREQQFLRNEQERKRQNYELSKLTWSQTTCRTTSIHAAKTNSACWKCRIERKVTSRSPAALNLCATIIHTSSGIPIHLHRPHNYCTS